MKEDDPISTFFEAVGECLEVAVRHFKAGDPNAAAASLSDAVELCEQHPAYAMHLSPDLRSSLQKVVHGCISNAIAKGHSGPKMLALLARIEAIPQIQRH
jgi:hypothetical protein